MSRADGFRLTAAWVTVAISLISMAIMADLWKGRTLYAPKADYVTRSDFDSLRWEVKMLRQDVRRAIQSPIDGPPSRHR